jgi:hypothetical protein
MNAATAPESRPMPSIPAARTDAVGATPVAMVMVVVAAAPALGVTDAGEKLQVELAGSPLQAKVMAAPNPKEGVAVMVELPLLPLATVIEGGLSERLKPGLPTVTVTAVEVELAKTASPAYCAVMLFAPTGSVVVVYVAVPVPSTVTMPRAVAPFRKVTAPVGIVVAPVGGATTAVSVTLVPEATLAALAVRVVVEARGAGGATVVEVSGAVFAASTLPALSVAML